jgi:hypothetical protein
MLFLEENIKIAKTRKRKSVSKYHRDVGHMAQITPYKVNQLSIF